MQKVNILGTEYEIIREAFEEETMRCINRTEIRHIKTN